MLHTPTPSPTPTPMPTPTPTATPTPGSAPSESSTVTVSDNSATVDQGSTTGVKVTVSGSSLQNGAKLNVTSTDYGGNQPSGTGAVSVNGAHFYDVQVSASSGVLGSDVTVTVSISNPTFTSSSVIEYWNGSTWVSAATTFTAPDTVSGAIPASALTETPILVGTPKSNAPTLNITYLSIIAAVAAVLVILAVVFLVKKRNPQKTVN